jgi:hypothetical protein
VKRQSKQRSDPGENERALLAMIFAPPAHDQCDRERDERDCARNESGQPSGDQKLQGIAVRELHEKVEAARLNPPKRFAIGAQA